MSAHLYIHTDTYILSYKNTSAEQLQLMKILLLRYKLLTHVFIMIYHNILHNIIVSLVILAHRRHAIMF